MITTESGAIDATSRCIFRQHSPVFASNRPEHRRFGPFWASQGRDLRPLEIRQPLQVVAGRHHRQRKTRARLAKGPDQLATPLLYGRERLFDAGPGRRNPLVTSPLDRRQRLVPIALALNPVPVAVLLGPGFPFLGRVTPLGIGIPTRVGRIEDSLEVLAVVGAGRIGHDLAEELVLPVDVHRQLIDDLAAACEEALLEQLRRDASEDRLGTDFADPALEGPHRRPIRNVGCLGQTAEVFVAHPCTAASVPGCAPSSQLGTAVGHPAD